MKSESERMESKAIRELRKKNQRLATEVRRLRKMIKNAENSVEDDQDEGLEAEFDDKNIMPPLVAQKPRCPKCNVEGVHVFELMEREYYKCEACGGKGRYDKTT